MAGPLTIMTQVNHQGIAVALALSSMFGSIVFGISGTIWTNDLPREMYKALPD